MKITDLLQKLANGETLDLTSLTRDELVALRTEALDGYGAAKKLGQPETQLHYGRIMAAATDIVKGLDTAAAEAAAHDELAAQIAADSAPTVEPELVGAGVGTDSAANLPDVGPVTAAGQHATITPTPTKPKGPVLTYRRPTQAAIMAAAGTYESFAPGETQPINEEFAGRIRDGVMHSSNAVRVGRIASIAIPMTDPRRVGASTATVNNRKMDDIEEVYSHSLTAASLTCAPPDRDKTVDPCFGGITSWYDAMAKVPMQSCSWAFRRDIGPDPFVAGKGCDDLTAPGDPQKPAPAGGVGVTEWTPAVAADCNGGKGPDCREHVCEYAEEIVNPDKVEYCEVYDESFERCDPELLAVLMQRHAAGMETSRDRRLLWEFDDLVNQTSGWYKAGVAVPGQSGVYTFLDALVQMFESDGSWMRGSDMSDYRLGIPAPLLRRFMLNDAKSNGFRNVDMSAEAIVSRFGFGGIVEVMTDPAQAAAPLLTTLAGGTCSAPTVIDPTKLVSDFTIRLIPNRLRVATTGVQEWVMERTASCSKTKSVMYEYMKTFNRGCITPKNVDICFNANGATFGSLEPAAGSC